MFFVNTGHVQRAHVFVLILYYHWGAGHLYWIYGFIGKWCTRSNSIIILVFIYIYRIGVRIDIHTCTHRRQLLPGEWDEKATQYNPADIHFVVKSLAGLPTWNIIWRIQVASRGCILNSLSVYIGVLIYNPCACARFSMLESCTILHFVIIYCFFVNSTPYRNITPAGLTIKST